jgi:hypothetical protein
VPHSNKRTGPDRSWGWARNLSRERAERVLSVALPMIESGATCEDVAHELNSRLQGSPVPPPLPPGAHPATPTARDFQRGLQWLYQNQLWTARHLSGLLRAEGHGDAAAHGEDRGTGAGTAPPPVIPEPGDHRG